MPLNFLNPVKQEYVSDYIPAPIKEIADTGEVLQNRYDVVTDNINKLKVLAKNKRTLAGDNPVLQEAIGKIEGQLQQFAGKGNYEDADYVVNQLATDFITDKAVQDAEMSYRGYQERDAAIKKYGKSALDFAPIDPATYSTSKQGVYSPRVEERKDWETKRFSFFDNIPVTGFDGKTKSLSAVEAEKKGYPGMSITERSSQMGITRPRIEQRATEALPNYLNTEEGIQEYEALVAIDGLTPAQARETIKQRMIKSGLERTGLVTKTEYLENTAGRSSSGGNGNTPFGAVHTRPSEYYNPSRVKPNVKGEFDTEGNLVVSNWGSDSKPTQAVDAMKNAPGMVGFMAKYFPNVTEVTLRAADAFDESLIPDEESKKTPSQSMLFEQAKQFAERTPGYDKTDKKKAINNIIKDYAESKIATPINFFSDVKVIKDVTDMYFPKVEGKEGGYMNSGEAKYATFYDPETNQYFSGDSKSKGASFDKVINEAKDIRVVGQIPMGNPVFKGHPGFTVNVDGKTFYMSPVEQQKDFEGAFVESLRYLPSFNLATASVGPDGLPARLGEDKKGQFFEVVKDGKTYKEYLGKEDYEVASVKAALNLFDRVYGK